MTILRSVTLMAVALFALSACLTELTPATASTPPTNPTGGSGNPGGPLAITAPTALTAEATGAFSNPALGTATASGGDGSYTITNDAPAGGFPLGAMTVTWTAMDGTGAQVSAPQSVTVSDTRAPMISNVNSIQAMTTGALTPVTIVPPTVMDLVDPNPVVTNNIPAAGYPLGTTVVVWTATDAMGNVSTANQDVVITTTAPAATGAQLYATNCESCHGPLATSARRGRTATEITTALATQPAMAGITLTPAEVNLIAAALANTTSALFNVMLSNNAVVLDLRRNTTITATIQSVNGFAGPVDVSVTGLSAASGTYVVEPSPTANVPANGSVNVTIRFTTAVTSLAVASQPLRVNVRDQNTLADIDGGSIDYTVNNLLEISFDQNSGTNNGTHRWNGLRGTNLTLRPNTKAIWTNYDTTATHIVHGSNPIPHGPTNNPLDSPAVIGQRGESYGANGVGFFNQGQVTPLTITGGAFYCHIHGDGGSQMTIVINNGLPAQPN